MINNISTTLKSLFSKLTIMKFDIFFTYESLFLLLAFILLVITYYRSQIIRNPKSPPGPWNLPLVGYLPWLGDRPHLTFVKMTEKYGNVFQMKLGQWNAVILNGYAVVNEALTGRNAPLLADRPDLCIDCFNNGHGIKYRTHFLNRYKIIVRKTLMSLVFCNRQYIHDTFVNATEKLITMFAKTNGQPYNPKDDINLVIGNIITDLIYRKDFSEHDKVYDTLITYMKWANDFAETGNFVNFTPRKVNKFVKIMDTIQKTVLNLKKGCKNKDGNDTPINLVKAMDEMKRNGKNITPFKNEDMDSLACELMHAGFASIASTLQWSIILMANHPDIQKKVQDEIDSVFPNNIHTSVNNKKNNYLVFTNVTLLEIQRFASVFPLGISRFTTENINLEGYKIPKDTIVIPNFWSVNRDPKIWDKPNEFNPNRFLNLEENKILSGKAEHIFAFGAGRRRCAGELLAKMELFVLFFILMQRFKFKSVKGKEIDLSNYSSGLFLSPNSFVVSINSRTLSQHN